MTPREEWVLLHVHVCTNEGSASEESEAEIGDMEAVRLEKDAREEDEAAACVFKVAISGRAQ